MKNDWKTQRIIELVKERGCKDLVILWFLSDRLVKKISDDYTCDKPNDGQ